MPNKKIKTYTKRIRMSKQDYDYWRALLAIENLDRYEYDDEFDYLDAKTDDFITVCSVQFPDGAVITIELLSSTHNYWAEYTLYTPDRRRIELEQPDVNIFAHYGINTYICITDEKKHITYSVIIDVV